MQIDASTGLCAVIGNPVKHSLSPLIHNAAFEAAGINCVYLAFLVEDVARCLAGMRAMPSFRGMSVTIPHKIAVMAHLDEVEPMAARVGSVNTIVNEDGRLVGSTTDGPGTLRAFEDAGVSLDGKRVLFIGSGGAVRAVAFAVAELARAAGITVAGRTPDRVRELAEDVAAGTGAQVEPADLARDLPRLMATHDAVIHGTPVGMHPRDGESCVPAALFRPGQVVFDMVYRPLRTRLLAEAEAAGCVTIPGIDMLINQAALQFERWTGMAAPVDVMRQSVAGVLT